MGRYDFNSHDDDDDMPWWLKVLLSGMGIAALIGLLTLVKLMGLG